MEQMAEAARRANIGQASKACSKANRPKGQTRKACMRAKMGGGKRGK